VESPGLAKGSIMVKNILYLLQPSISADSSISFGIPAIKLVRIKTEIGSAKATSGPIMALILSYIPRLLVIWNTGINVM
jgi:hypothetical protein